MVRMALIGAGTMGGMYARAYSQHPSCEFVAVCDLDVKKAKSLARSFRVPNAYEDYKAMLRREDLDAVTVATPDFHHRRPAVACLKAGAAVLCEKPLATTMKDCAAICEAVEKHDGTLMVNYGNRHKRKIHTIKARLDAGELGRIENAFVQLREPIHKTKTLQWLDKTTPTFFLLSHCTDTVIYLIGGMPVEVYAKATRGVLSSRGINTPDAVIAMLTFDNGAVVTMDANWIMPRGFAPQIDFRLELIGEKGAIYCKLRSDDLMHYTTRAQALDYDVASADPLGFVHGWWNDSVHYFLRCVDGGIKPAPTAEDGLKVTRVLLAIEESARKGRAVTL
jgi:predicted dehydrogenase